VLSCSRALILSGLLTNVTHRHTVRTQVTEINVQNSTDSATRHNFLNYREKKFVSNMSDILNKNVTNFVGIKDEAKDVSTPPTRGIKSVEESGVLPLMQVRN